MNISITSLDVATCIHLSERVEGFDYSSIQKTLRKQLSLNKPIIIDLKQCQYINSTAIATICTLANDFENRGLPLALTHIPPALSRTFSALNVEKLLSIYKNTEDAVAALSTP